jgi:hypothetical protein
MSLDGRWFEHAEEPMLTLPHDFGREGARNTKLMGKLNAGSWHSLLLSADGHSPAVVDGYPTFRFRPPTFLEVFGGVEGAILGLQLGKGFTL